MVAFENLPAGQSSHSVEPRTEENFPAAQGLQLPSDDCLGNFENFPCPQAVQAESPDAAKLPAWHGSQASKPPPPVTEVVPSGHDVHIEEPSGAYVPAAHGSHAEEFCTAEIFPALQAVHAPTMPPEK